MRLKQGGRKSRGAHLIFSVTLACVCSDHRLRASLKHRHRSASRPRAQQPDYANRPAPEFRLSLVSQSLWPRTATLQSFGQALGFDSVNFNLVVKRLASDAEAFGGFQLVAASFLEDFFDGIALHRFHEREIFDFVLTHHGGDG